MIRYTMEEAKAHFEELIEQVKAGEQVEVLQGEEVVRVQAAPSRLGAMRGTGKILGDLVAPFDEPWSALQ
jgi:prevent-host-death family protein